MRFFASALAVALVAAPVDALADQPSPSEGVPLPDPSISTQSDAASLELNPAGLGYIDGAEAGYGFFSPTDEYDGTVPSGHSVTFGTGGAAGGLGVGMQWIDNPFLEPERQSFRKFSLGGALSPSRKLSVGANLNSFSSRTDQRLNDLRTTDVGLQWRPSQTFGVGLMARDVRPSFLDEDSALPTRMGAGLALRGFDGRLVYETEFHHVSGADEFAVQPRLATEPISGLRFFGRGSINVPWPRGNTDPEFDGLSVGMEVSLGTLGVQAARHLGTPGRDIDATTATGMSYRLWAGSRQKRALVSISDRWIRLSIDDSITEQPTTGFFAGPSRSFLNLVNDIDAIAEDPGVDGIIFEIEDSNLGHAQIWEFYEALDRLHDAGKESIAVIKAEAPTTSVVYTASAADEVWMRPSSPYGPTGMNVELTSYARLLETIGIEAEFMRIGEYKSAPESFVLPGPTEPAIEQTEEYLDTLYDEMIERIAQRRDVEPDELREVIDESPLYPAEALDQGLVDALLYDQEIDQRLERRIDSPLGLESGYDRREIADMRWGGRPEIAVVYVDGMMISGQSGQSPFGGQAITGAETLTQTLRSLREDDDVKAVVLRIDSPGGSAVAADLIYRELRHLASRKPVVASMGNVAASGGYFAAAGADEIMASPVTLTGSIGAYVGKFNIESLAEQFGVTSRQLQRGDRAGVFSPWRPWTDSEREGVAETLEYIYQIFIQQVAANRPLSADEIDEVGRGRVWTGQAAVDEQLTDEIGGLSDALRRAEELAGLETGQALYTDRTGAGTTALSPGMATRARELLDVFGILDHSEIARPDGQLPETIEDFESSLLWPLYFDADEPVFLPPFQLSHH